MISAQVTEPQWLRKNHVVLDFVYFRFQQPEEIGKSLPGGWRRVSGAQWNLSRRVVG